jgi:predicted AlkP superfamily phosphohydrolase/phosphomutase
VIGLDGLEPSIVGPMLDAGELPNLARMRERGGYSRVATTSPAQTPVAWSTFATGTNPGGHGIFDFLRRDPMTYRPDIGLNRHEPAGAFRPPRAVNLRRGEAVWDLLAARGVVSTILRCPATYPPDPKSGRMLSGMGVPDLRGGFGTATLYTSGDARALEGERMVKVADGSDGPIATRIIGPTNPRDRSDLSTPISIDLDPIARTATIRAEGAPEGLVVAEGCWSDWLRVSFKAGLFQTVRGIVRFHLARVGPTFELYASPVNFDPEAPAFPISHPPEFSKELAEELGLFHTTGMVEDHGALNNGRIDEHAYLDQCDLAWREREAMLLRSLDDFEDGLLYCLFDTPDRVQHMFWRFRDPAHPLHEADPEMARVVEDQYRRSDAMVGHALEFADDETLVVALSDHGFGPFRRAVHLNTWLLENGLLRLKPGLEAGEAAGDMLRGVDWSATKAYSLGLGGIYLNLRGREAEGIVDEADAARLKAEIARGLFGLPDPSDGSAAIRRVKPREEVYSGPFVGEAPDLLVHFSEGYRASSGTSMGGVAVQVFEDNRKKWSGDHIVDPALVPGVLFLDRPFRGEGARLEDLAPTILGALGVPKGAAMEGSSLIS